MDFTELRRHPRFNVDLFVDWGWGPECEYYDKVTSLSLSGCFLATRRDLNRGDEIFLRLSSESSGVINLKGAVRYQMRVMEGAPPTGVGVEFVGLSNNGQAKLQQVLNSYAELA
jgi:Tfp pilus assembly protein PilZ